MYILVDNNNRVLAISATLNYQENGNPLVYDDSLAIASLLVKKIYEYNDEIDEKYNSSKYCYSEESGFYVDPNWKPIYTLEDRVSAIEDTINMLLGFEED